MTSIAGPRVPFSVETYTGDELRNNSARPGAYDAMGIPSRIGCRLVAPSELKRERVAPAPTASPITSRAPVATVAPDQTAAPIPSASPPAEALAPAAAASEPPERMAAALLAMREAELQLWQTYVGMLQLRGAISELIPALPSVEPPALAIPA